MVHRSTNGEEISAPEFIKPILSTSKMTEVPHLYQNDYDIIWRAQGSDKGCKVRSEGCFFTCVSMLCSYFSGQEVTPKTLASIESYRKFVSETGNMALDGPREMIEDYGGTVAKYYREPYDYIKLVDEILDGKIAIIKINDKCIYTSSTHYIVIKGITEEGDFIVNDPNRKNYNNHGEIYPAQEIAFGAVYMYTFY